MNTFKTVRGNALARIGYRAVAFLSIFALLASTFAAGAGAQQKSQAPRMSEDQRILHVLNRLGFGARPGDIDRVKAMGLDRYIEQQLNPEKIDDAVVEAKIKNLPSLQLSTAELYAKYPQPGRFLRQMQQRGELPADLASLRENRVKGAAATPSMSNAGAGAMPLPDAGEMMNAPAGEAAKKADAAKPEDRADYRRAIRDYYMQNNLEFPQRITAELQASRILRAVYSERQLQEVLVDFWTNHFNVFAGKGADRWLLVSYDRDTIRPHTLGKFRDLLQATAQSPAMLFYLDNFQSVSPNGAAQGYRSGQRPLRMRNMALEQLLRGRGMDRRAANPGLGRMPQQGTGEMHRQRRPPEQVKRPKRGINENYARELMELHTLGVDGGYTQKDVPEVARCFTGWTIFNPRGGLALEGAKEKTGTFFFNPRLHDDGEKIVLGHKIPAGGGMKDGLMVLDILARHPSTAKFIATKLARRFVMDNPTPALIERIAVAFTKSDGDIRETLRAIFTSPEFNSPAAYRAKIKTPFELAVSAIRTLGGETNGAPPIHQWIARMGEPLYLYQAPTGYPDVAENWVNTGSLLERLNYGLALASNRIPGTRVDLARFVGDATANGPAVDKTRVMERFLDVIVQGDISPKTKATLLKQLNEAAVAPVAKTDTDKLADAQANTRAARREMARMNATVGNPEVTKIVGLILGSPEFQRQ